MQIGYIQPVLIITVRMFSVNIDKYFYFVIIIGLCYETKEGDLEASTIDTDHRPGLLQPGKSGHQ
ncbi:hypothetical protein SDC9_75641 [bioreactor metagenome]|uniref:Uncharacterized protein n=1 Tax=bioreactor metagenome TaxID=1076179 RepID=A0A644YKD4_9ZZZZ